jgi:leucine dehydrogenase
MDDLIKTWDGESVITRYDADTDTWMFIAIHSTSLGVATGGTRFKSYPTPREALYDAMRLAEGMTYKWAGIGFPRGGGKAVLGSSDEILEDDRLALLSRYGDWLSDLKGIFETGPDLGTTPNDMDLIRGHYSGIFGCTEAAGGQGDPGPYTALGVFSGIQASCERIFGTSNLSDRSVIVQGAGSVGEPLIRYLVEAGCKVCFSDVDADRIDRIQAQFDLELIDPQAVYAEPCDVFAPCATGGILNTKTIPALKCSIVAGGANNQLENPEDADDLMGRGILYAPDFIINAGGALYLVSIESMGWTEVEARKEILKIGDTLEQIFTSADEFNLNTGKAAVQLARDRIQAAGQMEGKS